MTTGGDSISEDNSQGRVLIVDDESNILRSLVRLLEPRWTLATAETGEEGLRLIERFEPQVIMADCRMDQIGGLEFLERGKAMAPMAQRILLTGYAELSSLQSAVNRAEIFRLLFKPWDDQELEGALDAAIAHYKLLEQNANLSKLIEHQNEDLRQANLSLEKRIQERTLQLELAKTEWEASFDSIQVPLAIVNEDYAVRRANKAYTTAAHTSIESIGRYPNCYKFLFHRTTPCSGCRLSEAIRGSGDVSFQVNSDKRMYVVDMYPVPGQRRAVCTYRDVTNERAITRQLIQAEKMAAIGVLAGGVAHEINNPLSGILGFSQLMKREQGRTPDDLESLGHIEESALRCKRIVEALVRFSRTGLSDSKQPIDLSKCADDAVILVTSQLKANPGIVLHRNLARDLPRASGSQVDITQVIVTLLQNAMHALPGSSGSVRLETGVRGGSCYCTVSDDGVGIPAELLPRLFEPGLTTKPPGQGIGFGLSVAYRIIQEHAGHIEVQTTGKSGTTVLFDIPSSRSGPPS